MLFWHKIIVIAFILQLCFFTSIKNSLAEQPEKNSFEIMGINSLYLNYNASDEIKEQGQMYGIELSYRRFIYNKFMFKVEGMYDFGDLDYSSTSHGKMNNINNWLFEGRILSGYKLTVSEGSFITSYIGIGFRSFWNGLNQRFASEGLEGNEFYEKITYYHYIPIGINFSNNLNKGWSYIATAEYDYFLNGKITYQMQHYDNNVWSTDTVFLKQKSGYGLRGSIKMRKTFIRILSLVVEPFVRYWNIDESDSQDVAYYKGIQIGETHEPENRTMEVGANVMLNIHF